MAVSSRIPVLLRGHRVVRQFQVLILSSNQRRLKSTKQRKILTGEWNASVQELASRLKTIKSRMPSESSTQADSKRTLEELCIKGAELNGMVELASVSGENGLMADVTGDINDFCRSVDNYMLEQQLHSEEDSDAILTITAGAGGVDSQHWAEMLANMYQGWALHRNFKFLFISKACGNISGFRSVSFKISGSFVYTWLKGETGVHRLVRISPFDSKKKRHASFVSVLVYAVAKEGMSKDSENDALISSADVRIETFKSSGPGGQHANKTESSVRITHVPTETTVECQQGRSQIQNRKLAFELLKAKLKMMEKEKEKHKKADERKRLPENEWASQTRSYVMQPYQLVKGSKSGYVSHQIDSILNGQIDELLMAQLVARPFNTTSCG